MIPFPFSILFCVGYCSIIMYLSYIQLQNVEKLCKCITWSVSFSPVCKILLQTVVNMWQMLQGKVEDGGS